MAQGFSGSLEVVLHVIEILNDLGVRYHLGGSFASAIHGVPRQTRDADLVVDLAPTQGQRLAERLGGDFYVDSEVVSEAVAARGSFNVIHLASGFKVDFFVVGTTNYDAVEFERSELQQIVADPPRSAYVKSAEDTVLRKLLWYRDGGEVSDRQWRDVLGILMTQGETLDPDYLQKWAFSLGLAALLKRALDAVADSA